MITESQHLASIMEIAAIKRKIDYILSRQEKLREMVARIHSKMSTIGCDKELKNYYNRIKICEYYTIS